MVEIEGGYYEWSQEELNDAMNKILKGGTLVIQYNKKKAYINYALGSKEVSFQYANLLVMLNVVGCEGGNFERGERYYDINNR